MKKRKLTVVSTLHYIRLIYRSALLLALLVAYLAYRFQNGPAILTKMENRPKILIVIWAVFMLEMLLRFFPSHYESPGCQKQFARNYIKSGETEIVIEDNYAAVLIAILWIIFNGVFGALHMAGILDDGIMILLCSVYSVCDMICILFFCPFQSWFMKNKCCSTCRIYNWDYTMMFTPLFFVPRVYSWSLLAMSLALFVRWEITFFRYPERFSERTNEYMRCANCSEKLCVHKKQLKTLWKEIEAYTEKRIRFLRKGH